MKIKNKIWFKNMNLQLFAEAEPAAEKKSEPEAVPAAEPAAVVQQNFATEAYVDDKVQKILETYFSKPEKKSEPAAEKKSEPEAEKKPNLDF